MRKSKGVCDKGVGRFTVNKQKTSLVRVFLYKLGIR